MRVLQVIDTLDAGGAERMAINYANALARHVEGSHICCTRGEGILKNQLNGEVGYYFLEKRSSLDRSAFKNLKNYVLSHKIDIIHAHSTSYFLCALVKMNIGNKVKLIWHDHYGQSEFLEKRAKSFLWFFSGYFDGVLSVNEKLADWARKNLRVKKVRVFKNFLSINTENPTIPIELKGNAEDFKIICVANLRPQKDHLNLLKAFEKLEHNNVSLHLIGKDFKDDHSHKVFNFIENSEKRTSIFFYGSQENVMAYLMQADVGVLASRSEGLPLALLEYGLACLPIICTDVGECIKIIENNGIIVKHSDPEELAVAMARIYSNDYNFDPENLKFKIKADYSENSIITQILKFYRSI